MALLIEDLQKFYGGRPVVNQISFTINPGEIVGLLGPNGAGKTTSFYCVVGITKPDGGQIRLNDRVLNGLPIHERAQAGIGYLPQEASVYRGLSVEDNLMLVLEFRDMSQADRDNRVTELLEEFGLTKLRKKPAIQLSGGERRRVEIARAIASDPAYLLLDEPFTGIDPIAIHDIQGLIRHLRNRGIGILLTDHNPKATLSIVDRGYIVHDGQVIFSGTNQEVSENELVRKSYLGEDFTL